MKTIFVLATLVAVSLVLFGQEIPKNVPPIAKTPHVVLMSMGGTIASRASERMNITNYGGKGVPRVDPQDWVHDMPELANIARITLEDFRPPTDRAERETFDDMRTVAKRLNEIAGDPDVDGVVITHGTNTMAEVAFYVNLTVRTEKPIVFVGSQRPWTGISGDGPLNLYDAIRVAASPQARGKGVLHCMNQNINTARDVTKTSAYRVQTFKGVDVGAIGFADPDRIVFYREPTRRHTTTSEFAGTDFKSLPPVEIFYGYTEAPGYVIDAAVEHGVKGIVVDGVGAGVATASETEAIKRAQAKGVVVVMTARVHGGRVQETVSRTDAKIVNGDNLPPEKARLLLQMALTKTSDWREVKKYFDEY